MLCDFSFSSVSNFFTAEFAVELQPFQLLYTTNPLSNELDSYYLSNQHMDELKLLQVTRLHLSSMLQIQLDNLDRTTLYHAIRTSHSSLFANGTKVAYSGTAYFEGKHPTEILVESVYGAFLGHNATLYEHQLRARGWYQLARVQVLTMTGDMVANTATASSNIVFQGDDDSMMSQDMSMAVILIAILVPACIMLVFGLYRSCYFLRYHIQWQKRRLHDIWKSECDSLRRETRELDVSETHPDDTGSGGGGSSQPALVYHDELI
jgi:hypothetical protein